MVTQDEANEYLDGLRESGGINMAGAGPYLQAEFGIDRHEARNLLREWMDTFGERHGLAE
jgi:hypothetical protein